MEIPLKELPGVIGPGDAAKIIEAYRPRLTTALTGKTGNRAAHFSRVADNFKFHTDTEWTLTLRKLAAVLSGNLPIDKVEPVELVRYPKDGYYMRHKDGRQFTLSVYLNNDYTGGELLFTDVGRLYEKIPQGMGLFWQNTPEMAHECKPVLSGEKWILTIWVN